MTHSRRLLLLAGTLGLAIVACTTPGPPVSPPASITAPSDPPLSDAPSRSAAVADGTPSQAPEPVPSASPEPETTPDPSPTPAPSPTRGPDKAWRGDAAQALAGGIRNDLRGTCRAVQGELRDGALAALRCPAPAPGIDLVTIRLYGSRWELADAYAARVAAAGIAPMSHRGRCLPRQPSEGGYVPGDGRGVEVVDRSACWTGDDGSAHYLATIPSFVLVRVDGRAGSSIPDLEAWAWLGSRDQPGNPSLWSGRR